MDFVLWLRETEEHPKHGAMLKLFSPCLGRSTSVAMTVSRNLGGFEGTEVEPR